MTTFSEKDVSYFRSNPKLSDPKVAVIDGRKNPLNGSISTPL